MIVGVGVWSTSLATIVAGLALVLIWAIPAFRGEDQSNRPSSDARAAANSLALSLENNRNFLRYLASDLQRGVVDEEAFRAQAGRFVATHGEMRAIRWEGAHTGERWMVPVDFLEGSVGSATAAARTAALAGGGQTEEMVYSRPFYIEGEDGPRLFEVYAVTPVGVVAGTYSMPVLVAHVFSDWLRHHYQVAVLPLDEVGEEVTASGVAGTSLAVTLVRRPQAWNSRATVLGLVALWMVTGLVTAMYLQGRALLRRTRQVHTGRQELDDTRRIAELARSLVNAPEETAERLVIETARSITGSAVAIAASFDADDGRLVLPDLDENVEGAAFAIRLAAWAESRHSPSLLPSGRRDGGPAPLETVRGGANLGGAACAVAVHEGRRIGVVAVAWAGRDYDETDLDRLQQVAAPYGCLLLRRRAMRAVSRSERHHRMLLEQAADPVVLFSPAGRVLQANRRAREVLGYDSEELTALSLRDIEAEAQPDDIVRLWATLEPGRGLNVPGAFLRKDGSRVPVEVRFGLVDEPRGDVMAVARDVTERRHAEEMLTHIARGVSSQTGAWFLRSLAEHLLENLPGADRVVVAELVADDRRLRVLAVEGRDGETGKLEFDLAGTLSADLLANRGALVRSDLDESLAADPLLGDRPYRCLVGVAIRDTRGEPMGVLAVLARKRFTEPVIAASIIEIHASRVAGELERLQSETELETERSFMQQVIDGVTVPVVVMDADYKLKLVNLAARRLGATDPSKGMPTTCYQLSHQRDTPCEGESHPCPLRDVMRTRAVVRAEHIHQGPAGQRLKVELEAAPVFDADGEIIAVIETMRDVTRQREAEQRLQEHSRQLDYLAHHDPLTDLPNRVLFRDRLNQAIIKAHRDNRTVALMFVDLDGFKDVNDTLGHDVGDELLKVVAERLRRCVRASDTVARHGGDEFTLVLDDVQPPSAVRDVAAKAVEQIARPIRVAGHELTVGASIGIALYPDDGHTVDALVRNADAAMYLAKDSGRGNFKYFTPLLNTQARQRTDLEAHLRHASRRGELRVVYQPQYDLITGRVESVEALLRWQHPDLGLLRPDRFLEVAEETGLINDIGLWVVRTACGHVRSWQDAGLPAPRIALNLSARQLQHVDLPSWLEEMCSLAGVRPGQLELEVGEQALLEASAVVDGVLQRLFDAGFQVVVDNFGAGGSSFRALECGYLAKIKLAQVFASGAGHAQRERLARALVQMAHSIGLRVVGAGVEEDAQLAFMRQAGFDYAQGHLLGLPLAAAEVVACFGDA